MSGELVRFDLGGGSAGVYVEMPDDDPGVERARRRVGGTRQEAVDGFEAGLDQIRDVAGRTLRRITAMPSPPSTVELEFGVKFSVEAGAVIARTGVEGHVKVKVVWERTTPGHRLPQDEDEDEDEGGGDGGDRGGGGGEGTGAVGGPDTGPGRGAGDSPAPGLSGTSGPST
ncbi:CU044_2847 family protein [Streptomyces sp. NRRL S-340]|uniref:CU044_2847 family protein n=1 Tax=Streptomyces sp. NRRL S-340 TaxID=1463901 RepID=UPI0007C4C393|nr:CU044_2847 family protein [Streptomyces sp. NRRL S-340]